MTADEYHKVVELSAFIVRRYSRGRLTRNESETLLRKWFRFLWLPLPFAKSSRIEGSGWQQLVIKGAQQMASDRKNSWTIPCTARSVAPGVRIGWADLTDRRDRS